LVTSLLSIILREISIQLENCVRLIGEMPRHAGRSLHINNINHCKLVDDLPMNLLLRKAGWSPAFLHMMKVFLGKQTNHSTKAIPDGA